MATKTDDKGPGAPDKGAPAAPAINDVLRSYLIGLSKECPLDFITVPTNIKEGAPTFQKYTQKLSDPDDAGIAHLNEKMVGGFIKLFDDEVVKIKEYIASHGLHWLSRASTSGDGVNRVDIVMLTGDGAFRRSRREDVAGNIEPLNKYMFITPARTVSAESREAMDRPLTLLEEMSAPASK